MCSAHRAAAYNGPLHPRHVRSWPVADYADALEPERFGALRAFYINGKDGALAFEASAAGSRNIQRPILVAFLSSRLKPMRGKPRFAD